MDGRDNFIKSLMRICDLDYVICYMCNDKHVKNKVIKNNFPYIKNYFKSKIDNLECYICYNNIYTNEYVRELNCNHSFHKKCIDKWLIKCLQSTSSQTPCCPMCRKIVV